MVCGSWLNRSIDFHNGTSFFCNRSNSVEDALETSRSDISRLLKRIWDTNRGDLRVTQASGLRRSRRLPACHFRKARKMTKAMTQISTC